MGVVMKNRKHMSYVDLGGRHHMEQTLPELLGVRKVMRRYLFENEGQLLPDLTGVLLRMFTSNNVNLSNYGHVMRLGLLEPLLESIELTRTNDEYWLIMSRLILLNRSVIHNVNTDTVFFVTGISHVTGISLYSEYYPHITWEWILEWMHPDE